MIANPRRSTLVKVWVSLALLALAASGTLAQQQSPATSPSPNRVLELDGSGAYVELPVAAFEGLEEATIEAWVRWDDWDYFSQWFAYSTDDLYRSMGINHYSGTPRLQFFIYPGSMNALRAIIVETSLPLGKWYHTAAVSGSGGMRFYLEGALMGSDPYPGSFADLAPGNGVFLGKSPWEANEPFCGALDEVRLWSVARSAEEIRADMGRALRGDDPGLIALWDFDDGDARDRSANGHDGVLHAGARCLTTPHPGTQPRMPPAVVLGDIRDERGEPVVAARVLLKSRAHTIETGTESDGGFSVAVFDTGSYTLEVFNEGVRFPRREFSVTSGASIELELRQPPAHLVASWAAEGDGRDGAGEHHGELSGDVTFAPGVVGEAFQFGDGSGFVRVPNAPELNPQGSFSVVTWIFPESDRHMTLLGMWGDYGFWRNQRAYSLFVHTGRRLTFHIADSLHQEDAEYHLLHTRPNTLDLNAWTMVAAVWDAETGERRIYANGLLVPPAVPPAA